jgi:hypothetical protein
VTHGEFLYLVLVIAGFAAFAAGLAYGSVLDRRLARTGPMAAGAAVPAGAVRR